MVHASGIMGDRFKVMALPSVYSEDVRDEAKEGVNPSRLHDTGLYRQGLICMMELTVNPQRTWVIKL